MRCFDQRAQQKATPLTTFAKPRWLPVAVMSWQQVELVQDEGHVPRTFSDTGASIEVERRTKRNEGTKPGKKAGKGRRKT